VKHLDRSWLWAGLAVGLVAAGVGGSQAHALTAPTIGIEDFKYAPVELTVPVGTTVTWVNHDEEPHTVTAVNGAFASGGLVNEDRFAQHFAKPGTYQYACALHPYMRATVIVK
jgi:plastocyanin